MKESIICTTGWPLIWRLIKELWKRLKSKSQVLR